MADNLTVYDKNGDEKTLAYKDVSDVLFQKTILHNESGEALGVTNRALDIMIQDQYSAPIEAMFYNYLKSVALVSPGTAMTLATSSLILDSTTGLTVGDLFFLQEDGKHFEAIITAINAGTATITLDRPVNNIFSYDASAFIGKKELAVNGSSTNKVFKVQPPEGASWDINRIVIMMQDDRAMDDSLFGGITAITNGLILKAFYDYNVGGDPTRCDNFCVAKTNFELGLSFNSIQYDDRASGAGLYGMKAVKVFNSQQHNGVSIRLDGDTGDNLFVIVRDDLSGLTSFRIVAHGHTVE